MKPKMIAVLKENSKKFSPPGRSLETGEGIQFLDPQQEDWEQINAHFIKKKNRYWKQEDPQVKARTAPNSLMAIAEPLVAATLRNEKLEFLVGTGTKCSVLNTLQSNELSDASITTVGATGTRELRPFFKPVKFKLRKL